MIRTMMTAAALLMAAPAMAQTGPAPTTPTPAPAPAFTAQPIPPTDPVRLAAARPVIDRIWPAGTYARMMRTMMGPFMQGSIAHAMTMKPADILAGMGPGFGAGGKPSGKPEDNETLGQMAAKNDPYFQQRMMLSMNAVGDELAKLMTQVEPGVRDAMAHAYARRFTVAQLGELDRFFATPTGAAYASDSLTLMMSPDMARAMQAFTPNMIKAMPEMIAKVTDATKDLPPPGATAKKTP